MRRTLGAPAVVRQAAGSTRDSGRRRELTLFCPSGHGPFEEWAERCPECGRYLAGREPIVHLATAPNEPVAEMWLDELRRAGIRALAKALGPGFGAFGTSVPLEHALYVAAPDLESARRILAHPAGPRHRRGRATVNRRRKG